jgi:hypothetical protein
MDNNNEYFKHRFPDSQDEKAIFHCFYTGLEIYEGEFCIELPNGRFLKDDVEILIAYMNARRITVGE